MPGRHALIGRTGKIAPLIVQLMPMFGPASLRVQDEFAVRIFEEVVRFHILSEHELCEEDQSGERQRSKKFCAPRPQRLLLGWC